MPLRRALPPALFAEPVAAGVSALLTYLFIAKLLPGFLTRVFVASGGGSAEALRGPLHWVALAAAFVLLAQAVYLAGRSYRLHKDWKSGKIPACPHCGGLMKRKPAYWGCYRFPKCKGVVTFK